MDPDPGGPQTYGSGFGSGSATLMEALTREGTGWLDEIFVTAS